MIRTIYFTKFLQTLDGPALLRFVAQTGVGGLDLAVRPGYFIHPGNAVEALPAFAKQAKAAGTFVGLISSATALNDPTSAEMVRLYEACQAAEVPGIKIGYFPYKGDYARDLDGARKKLEGFAKLSERTKVVSYCHTHSGAYLGNNGATMRQLLEGFDPHFVAAYPDPGHLALNGGPIGMEMDLLQRHTGLLACKDFAWEKTPQGWKSKVVPISDGIVNWKEVAAALKKYHYSGTLVIHAEYDTATLEQRIELAKREQKALAELIG